MPELPEVETVRQGLEARLIDSTIADVTVRDRRLRWPIAADFESQLRGGRIVAIERRSKYLLFRLAGKQNSSLLAHLGMTGSFVVHRADSPAEEKTHDHVDVLLTGRRESLVLRYNDPRRFGSMHFFTGPDTEQPLLAHLGPEPLTDDLTGAHLYEQTRRRAGPIKQALMDNTLVVGVGNIYANEALFRAGVRPQTTAGRIGLARCERIVSAIKHTLELALKAGGSTLRDFVNSDGEPGSFQLSYRVYDRTGKPCFRCGNAIRTIRQGQRSTFFCPTCQH